MIWIILIIVIYLLFVYLSYKHIQIAHSKNGIWEGVNVEIFDVISMFVPGYNILYAFVVWTMFYPFKNIKNYNKFFRIKK